MLSIAAPFSSVIVPLEAEIVPWFVIEAAAPLIESLPRSTRTRPRFTTGPGKRADCEPPQLKSTVPSFTNGGLMVPHPVIVWPA